MLGSGFGKINPLRPHWIEIAVEEQGLLCSPGEDRSQGDSRFKDTKAVNETEDQLGVQERLGVF